MGVVRGTGSRSELGTLREGNSNNSDREHQDSGSTECLDPPPRVCAATVPLFPGHLLRDIQGFGHMPALFLFAFLRACPARIPCWIKPQKCITILHFRFASLCGLWGRARGRPPWVCPHVSLHKDQGSG